MKDKLTQKITEYIEESGHYGGEEQHETTKVVLSELKESLGLLTEDTHEGCKRVLNEFTQSHPDHKEMLKDFLKYTKYAK